MLSRVTLRSFLSSPIVFPTVSTKSFAKSKEVEFKIDTPYKCHRIDGPGDVVKTTPEKAIDAFKTMYTIRRMEQGADKMYKSKKIQGFLHLYNGQEAVVTGIESAITREDSIITAYRDHGFAYTRGVSVQSIYAELMGKVTGCSKGNGGSMHMYNGAQNFYGGNGIVGAQTPIGAGIAFKHKFNDEKKVCVALYGDGSANQGQLYEAFNMAYLWKLPVIYVCENNKYGMGTSIARAASNQEFFKRGDYVPGIQIDAMDYFSVKNAVDYAKAHAIENGPIVLEMVTYRYVGHSMSDPGTTYRTREEVDSVRKNKDPIDRVRTKLIANKICTEKEIKDMEKEIRQQIDQAMKDADADSLPPIEQTYQNVYWNEDIPVRGVELSKSYTP